MKKMLICFLLIGFCGVCRAADDDIIEKRVAFRFTEYQCRYFAERTGWSAKVMQDGQEIDNPISAVEHTTNLMLAQVKEMIAGPLSQEIKGQYEIAKLQLAEQEKQTIEEARAQLAQGIVLEN